MRLPSVPLPLFGAFVILWLLVTLAFGFLVRDGMQGIERTGGLSRVAVQIAGYPGEIKKALDQIAGAVTGEAADTWLSVDLGAPRSRDGLLPVAAAPGLGLGGLMLRGDPDAVTPGWRIATGAFEIDGAPANAALLIDPDMTVVRIWPVTETVEGDLAQAVAADAAAPGEAPGPAETDLTMQPEDRKMLHGIEVLDDGSMLVTFDGGVTLQRFDACGARTWSRAGDYSHSVNLAPGGATAWVVHDTEFVEVSVADGSVVRRLSTNAIIAANPHVTPLDIRLFLRNEVTANPRNTPASELSDPWHYNDVEPLPAGLVPAFPGFETGDLLISARSLNLVMVVDPDTARIKWWINGATLRQHDPDWQPDGRITVYDNRMGRDFSRIVAIDPTAPPQLAEVLFDGREADFYSRIRGKHQVLPDGTMIVSSPQQGRVLELAADGSPVLEFVNVTDREDANYVITEMRWLPPEAFAGATGCSTAAAFAPIPAGG